eukprot:5341706-Pleurochrysis_carterae.AAC.2
MMGKATERLSASFEMNLEARQTEWGRRKVRARNWLVRLCRRARACVRACERASERACVRACV